MNRKENYPVDFEEIKKKVSIEDIVNHFRLKFRRTKTFQLRGNCPFPEHGGDRNSESFAIHTQKDIYNCPTHCGGGSGAIDFYCGLKGYDRKHDSLKAAKELQEIFLCEGFAKRQHRPIKIEPVKEKEELTANKIFRTELTVETNADYLQNVKKLTPETLEYFGAGIATHGIFRGKFVVRMHNAEGEPIGYAGQDTETGKWDFRFKKSLELFNFHRVKALPNLERLIIVESFFSAMYLHQCGFKNVVALMGVWASERQIELLRELSDKFLLFLDNDESGQKGTKSLKNQLECSLVQNFYTNLKKPLQFSFLELKGVLKF